MSRASLLLAVVMVFAIVNTVFLALHLIASSAPSSQMGLAINGLTTSVTSANSYYLPPSPAQSTVQFFLVNSPAFSAASWAVVGGAWIWRGRMKSRWEGLGFDSGIFDLFIKMKGAKTRLNLLDSLSMPKDRLQLARELGLDWKAVDYHIVLLNRYGLVHEDHAFGNVKMYRLTKQGEVLLQLLKEFNKEIVRDTVPSVADVPSTLPVK